MEESAKVGFDAIQFNTIQFNLPLAALGREHRLAHVRQTNKSCVALCYLVLCGLREKGCSVGSSNASFGFSKAHVRQILQVSYPGSSPEKIKEMAERETSENRLPSGAIGLLFGVPIFEIESGAELRWEAGP